MLPLSALSLFPVGHASALLPLQRSCSWADLSLGSPALLPSASCVRSLTQLWRKVSAPSVPVPVPPQLSQEIPGAPGLTAPDKQWAQPWGMHLEAD